jgi:predicted nuclease of predicted toxin-antitoxin system
MLKLLFDHNLSPKSIDPIVREFPDSKHVSQLKLQCKSDEEILNYASENKYAVVTKDSDFNDLIYIRDYKVKVIWIRKGNCSVSEINHILEINIETIKKFTQDKSSSILIL